MKPFGTSTGLSSWIRPMGMHMTTAETFMHGPASPTKPCRNTLVASRPEKALYYNNRAAAFFQLKQYTEAKADLETCIRWGGKPHPGWVQALNAALEHKP